MVYFLWFSENKMLAERTCHFLPLHPYCSVPLLWLYWGVSAGPALLCAVGKFLSFGDYFLDWVAVFGIRFYGTLPLNMISIFIWKYKISYENYKEQGPYRDNMHAPGEALSAILASISLQQAKRILLTNLYFTQCWGFWGVLGGTWPYRLPAKGI